MKVDFVLLNDSDDAVANDVDDNNKSSKGDVYCKKNVKVHSTTTRDEAETAKSAKCKIQVSE
jgi:hypothetical protein